ncbi:HAD family hydrolase [Candidatus Saccharibacteria bacterium]|nr:HAD family hydrolase [Candidatus Saccharibacteria bacterium]
MISQIVFDWNGTLLADSHVRHRLHCITLNKLGHAGLSFNEYQEKFFIPITDYYSSLGISAEKVKKHGRQATEEFHTSYEALAAKCRTRGGARDTIKKIHQQGIKTIILSNHTIEGINIQLKRLNMQDLFDTILANDNIHTSTVRGKKDMLSDYIKLHKLMPSELVIVGDTVEETHIGHDLGLHSVAITGGTHSKRRLVSANPSIVISNLYDLIRVLEKL